jgi:hypothetical protein
MVGKLGEYIGKAKGSVKYIKENWPEIKKKATSTEGIIYGSIIVVILFIITTTVQSCMPRKGNILYGICGEFLNLQIPYPHTINKTQVEFYGGRAVRIYYTHIDPFGEYRLENIECAFKQDPEKGLVVETIYFDEVNDVTKKTRVPGKGKRYEVTRENLDNFNETLSPWAIANSEPDLTIPDDAIILYY